MVISANKTVVVIVAVSCWFLWACSYKNIPKGDALYTGATIHFEKDSLLPEKPDKIIQADLKNILKPSPNSKLLGVRIKLGMFNLAGSKNNFINNFLRKAGEPPVLISQVNIESNLSLMTNLLENKGYFKAHVSGDTNLRGKEGKAFYSVKINQQYIIRNIFFPDDSSKLSQILQQIAGKSIVRKGNPFVLDVIKAERIRIDAYLKENGYYYFNPDYLQFLADSTVGENSVDLYLKYKPDMPAAAKNIYTIKDVFIYSNYNLTTAKRDTLKSDSVTLNGYNVIDRRKTFKPAMFSRILMFSSGSVYNRTAHNISLGRLINLGTFQFVKNRFEPVTGTHLLDAYYYLTPGKKKSLSAEFGGLTRSNNVTGSEITIKWKNRNAMRSAELFVLSSYIGTEVQYSGQYAGYNTFRYGAEITLSSPRFLIPFFSVNTSNAFVPRSTIQVGYDILHRQKLYALNSFRAQLGYVWKPDDTKEHRFNPFVINYVQPLSVTEEYIKSIQFNPILKRSIDTQFIIGSDYNLNIRKMKGDQLNASGYYLNGMLDLSGNLAGVLTGASARNGSVKQIFGTPFSQYIKGELDVRKYVRVGLYHQWANRLIIGMGYPYGNSTILPFIKQFFVGGNNSLRGFRSRSVGPGSFDGGVKTDSVGFYPDMTGDLKLEFNSEFRLKLSGIFYAAVFADAGNIWLWNENNNQPGGRFSNKFLSELAVDAGIGMRVDLVVLLLRLDVGIPLRKPWLPEGQRSVVSQINFNSSKWRNENLIYNLAIGLPF